MQKFTVLSVQHGPLEGGGLYASIWAMPVPGDYEDRNAPHLTRGPVPIKIDTNVETINSLLKEYPDLPAMITLDLTTRVAAGNKSKSYVRGYQSTKTNLNQINPPAAKVG
jgi:hypothetical protein